MLVDKTIYVWFVWTLKRLPQRPLFILDVLNASNVSTAIVYYYIVVIAFKKEKNPDTNKTGVNMVCLQLFWIKRIG